jgi:hypothetical protein
MHHRVPLEYRARSACCNSPQRRCAGRAQLDDNWRQVGSPCHSDRRRGRAAPTCLVLDRCVAFHVPPRAVGIPRSFNPAAIARSDVAPERRFPVTPTPCDRAMLKASERAQKNDVDGSLGC